VGPHKNRHSRIRTSLFGGLAILLLIIAMLSGTLIGVILAGNPALIVRAKVWIRDTAFGALPVPKDASAHVSR
jgi:hypothetical protein